MNVKIKRLSPDAVIPTYATTGAAGFDLVAVEDVIIAPGETKLVRTGLAFEIPDNYELQIRPRSGVTLNTFLRVGNSPGTVDADFRGEVKVIIDNTLTPSPMWYHPMSIEDEPIESDAEEYEHHAGTYIIRKFDRIAQAVIAPVIRADFVEVTELGDTERGDGGFGSTGVNV